MSIAHISPDEAKRLIERGAVMVDVREADEHARECISDAKNHPVSSLRTGDAAGLPPEGTTVIFYCRSGNRTRAHAATLRGSTDCEAYVLDGGIEAWKKAGLPVARDAKQPLELMRQVQIVTGSLVVLGLALGLFVNPWFYAISGGVGAGLTFAGVTGTCALASVLAYLPCNRGVSCSTR